MAKHIPLEDFFKNPDKTAYKISPNGDYYAFMAPFENRLNIHIQKIGADDHSILTKEVDRDISGYFWVTDDRLLYLKDDGGDENFALYGVNRDGSNLIKLTKTGVKIQIIDDLEDIPDYVIIGTNERNEQIFDPYRLNINTGQTELLAENPGNVSGWLTDHNGKIRIAVTTDGVNTSILYRETEQEEFTNVITTDFKESFSPQFFEFDNSSVLYGTSNIGRDKAELVKFDLDSGEEIDVLFTDEHNDISGASYSRKRKVLTSVSWTAAKVNKHFFDAEIESIYKDLESKLSDVEIALVSANDDEDKFIVRTYSDVSSGAHHLMATLDGEPVGAARVRRTINGIKLERFAVLEQARGHGVGAALVVESLKLVKDYSNIYLHAQIQVVDFYKKFGFVTEGDEFLEANIRHYKMIYKP